MWDKIKNKAIWITSVSAAFIIFYKVFFNGYTVIFQKGVDKERQVQTDSIKEQKLDQLIESNQSLVLKVNNFSDTVKKVYDQNVDLKKQITDVKNKQAITINGLTKHLEASKQTDELVELLKSQLQ